jgi:hypothetical protein
MSVASKNLAKLERDPMRVVGQDPDFDAPHPDRSYGVADICDANVTARATTGSFDCVAI